MGGTRGWPTSSTVLTKLFWGTGARGVGIDHTACLQPRGQRTVVLAKTFLSFVLWKGTSAICLLVRPVLARATKARSSALFRAFFTARAAMYCGRWIYARH